MPAHKQSLAFEPRETDHVIQHVMHSFAVDHAPSAVAKQCHHPHNHQVEAITKALGERWTRQREAELERLGMDNKYVFRSMELGEMRAAQLMYATTHWRQDEDTTTAGTTTLNRVAAGHRIEEQNRVLFEHLLKSRPAVVANSVLKERAKRLEEKKKTMTHFRPQPSYPMPPLPRAFPLDEGLDDERHKCRLPPLHSSTHPAEVNEVRERGWMATTPRDVRDGASRRDGRLRGGSIPAKSASCSRTYDAHQWCNRESAHSEYLDTTMSTSRRR